VAVRANSVSKQLKAGLKGCVQLVAAFSHGRNPMLVDDSDMVIAFVAPDRTGGTEDTIRRAVRAGKPVEVR
jgi:hypothetical protein